MSSCICCRSSSPIIPASSYKKPTSSLAPPKAIRMESESSGMTVSELIANSKQITDVYTQTQQVSHLNLALVIPSNVYQFRHLVNSFNKPIFQEKGTIAMIVDRSLIIQAITEQSLNLLGRAADQLVGYHLSSFVKQFKGTACDSNRVIDDPRLANSTSITRAALIAIGDKQLSYRMDLIQTLPLCSNFFLAIFKIGSSEEHTPQNDSMIADLQQEKTIPDRTILGYQEAIMAKVREEDLMGKKENSSAVYFKPEMDIPGKKLTLKRL